MESGDGSAAVCAGGSGHGGGGKWRRLQRAPDTVGGEAAAMLRLLLAVVGLLAAQAAGRPLLDSLGDLVVSLQGSIPLDDLGNQASEPAG